MINILKIRLYFIIFSIVVLGATLYVWLGYSAQLKLSKTISLRQLELRAHSLGTLDLIQNVINDTCYIAKDADISELLESPSDSLLKEQQSHISALSMLNKKYDQLRIIDIQGYEIVRIDYKNEHSVIADKASLQNKADRYYVTKTIGLDRDGIYISPLDLNVEHGTIETPFKPTLRVSSPIVDMKGHKVGIVVTNFLAKNIMSLLDLHNESFDEGLMLLNHDGYWLSHPDESNEFGFMFKNQRSIKTTNPDLWSRIRQGSSGHIESKGDIWLYEWINIQENLNDCKNKTLSNPEIDQGVKDWAILSKIPRQTINQIKFEGSNYFVASFIILFLGLITLSFYITSYIKKHKEYENKLERLSTTDALTGILNRFQFYQELEKEAARSKRLKNGFSILYLDLDGFKNVNDTLGHVAGDEILKGVAHVLKTECRCNDITARLGGDEFVVLLFNTTEKSSALIAAKKIQKSIRELSVNGQHVDASIGISMWPIDSDSPKELIAKADSAMYAAKRSSEDDIIFA